MRPFSEDMTLNREHSFHRRVRLFVHLCLGGAWLAILGFGLWRGGRGGWSTPAILALVLGLVIFGYHCRAASAGTSVFYALHLWEQSLLRRQSDDELIRACRIGHRILKDGQEVEVFDGRLVPKPGGLRLRKSADATGSNEADLQRS
jgi:hypothetical protein